jgi:regulator of protease activity HflC (stomatin/prohibitin superfamily)
MGKATKGLIIGGLVGLGILIIGLNSVTGVKSGHTGVVTHFGAVSNEVMQEGLHGKLPFITKVIIMDNRTKVTEVASSASSKDLQVVKSKVAVNYQLEKNASGQIYKTVGTAYESVIIIPAIQESVKSVTAKFTAEELITKRQDISDQIKSALSEKIMAYGLKVDNFNIIDFDFSDEFNKAVEAKQTAQQNALKADQDLVRIKTEAQQQIEQAKAEAESYKLKSQQLTPEMVQMEMIKKWDGKLPTITSGDSGMILQLPVADTVKK